MFFFETRCRSIRSARNTDADRQVTMTLEIIGKIGRREFYHQLDDVCECPSNGATTVLCRQTSEALTNESTYSNLSVTDYGLLVLCSAFSCQWITIILVGSKCIAKLIELHYIINDVSKQVNFYTAGKYNPQSNESAFNRRL